MIKSRYMRWMRNVTCIQRFIHKALWDDIGIDGIIILKRILKNGA
jgi:hypothetical protein